MYVYSNRSRVATTNREVGWSSRQSSPPLFSYSTSGWCQHWPTWGYGNSWSIKWVRLVGGIPIPLKNDGVRELGWWHSLFIWWENNPNVPNQKRDFRTKSWGYSRIYSMRVNHEASPFFPISFPPNWDHKLVNNWRLELSLQDSKSGMEHRWFEYRNHK